MRWQWKFLGGKNVNFLHFLEDCQFGYIIIVCTRSMTIILSWSHSNTKNVTVPISRYLRNSHIFLDCQWYCCDSNSMLWESIQRQKNAMLVDNFSCFDLACFYEQEIKINKFLEWKKFGWKMKYLVQPIFRSFIFMQRTCFCVYDEEYATYVMND